MKIFKILSILIIVTVLTVLTQVGGILFILSFLTHKFINAKINSKIVNWTAKFASFLFVYLLATFSVVPKAAKFFGREPLPVLTTENVRPLNIITCLLNRHYVKPELKRIVMELGEQMNEKYPGTVVNFLDANFPFIDKFPLIPHLSHNDGKKLDLSFYYLIKETGESSNESPSFIGYGICEDPYPTERNTALVCAEKGYWQYSFLTKIIPQGNKKYYLFDEEKTRFLINLCSSKSSVSKIFLEPHLKSRLHLTSPKIRFHGCQAVRHDDHIHLQIK